MQMGAIKSANTCFVGAFESSRALDCESSPSNCPPRALPLVCCFSQQVQNVLSSPDPVALACATVEHLAAMQVGSARYPKTR
eukprot:723145-Pleurochrysis_carterae.AAC.4